MTESWNPTGKPDGLERIYGHTPVNEGKNSHVRTDSTARLREEGFSNKEIFWLSSARERYDKGEFSEETQESKRLLFGKWLFEHKRIGEGDTSADEETDSTKKKIA